MRTDLSNPVSLGLGILFAVASIQPPLGAQPATYEFVGHIIKLAPVGHRYLADGSGGVPRRPNCTGEVSRFERTPNVELRGSLACDGYSTFVVRSMRVGGFPQSIQVTRGLSSDGQTLIRPTGPVVAQASAEGDYELRPSEQLTLSEFNNRSSCQALRQVRFPSKTYQLQILDCAVATFWDYSPQSGDPPEIAGLSQEFIFFPTELNVTRMLSSGSTLGRANLRASIITLYRPAGRGQPLPGSTTSTNGPAASNSFRAEVNGCTGEQRYNGYNGRLRCVASVKGLPGDDHPVVYEWLVDGQRTPGGAAHTFFDFLRPGPHTVTVTASYNGQQSKSDTITTDVAPYLPNYSFPPTSGGPNPAAGPPVVRPVPPLPPTAPPAPTAKAPQTTPAQVFVKTARGNLPVDPSLDKWEIRLSPGDPKAEIAAKCNEMMITVLSLYLASDADTDLSQLRGRAAAYSVALASIRIACNKRLGVARLLGGAAGRYIRAFVPPQQGSTAVTPESTIGIELREGPIRFEAPHPDTALTVTSPGGSVTSHGPATFTAAYSPQSGQMAVEAYSGSVLFAPVGAGATATRLSAGQRVVAGSGSAPALPQVTRAGGPNTGPRPSPSASNGRCGLGRVWRDADPYWRGSWVRRGDSNLFDAEWVGGTTRVNAQMRIVLDGNRVIITRTGYNTLADGEIAEYQGVIGPDGVTVSGTVTWRNPRLGGGRWQATIGCE
ncbi:MAG: hypothetical protein JNN08_08960 [Bryobacterales bacterium]|nr:hypothetical protein [Bryobacterales bacterium]